VEAFHVFKIFVANPQKPPRVQQILYKNKDRLIKLLETLKANRSDEQFDEDKNTVIGKLQALEVPSRLESIPKNSASSGESMDCTPSGSIGRGVSSCSQGDLEKELNFG
jgi:hypothetical protein